MHKKITEINACAKPATIEEYLIAAETTTLEGSWKILQKNYCGTQIQNLLGDTLPKTLSTNRRLETLFRELGHDDLANKYAGFALCIESLPPIEKKPNFLSVSNVKARIAANTPKQM